MQQKGASLATSNTIASETLDDISYTIYSAVHTVQACHNQGTVLQNAPFELIHQYYSASSSRSCHDSKDRMKGASGVTNQTERVRYRPAYGHKISLQSRNFTRSIRGACPLQQKTLIDPSSIMSFCMIGEAWRLSSPETYSMVL